VSAINFVGRTLGNRYEIQTLIGQGGMASVYKAYDPNLRRAVAIKIIHPHLSNNPEFFHRFEEEATAVARLRHPNIVQVYDFCHDEDLYYMVMEFVMGETLQSRLKRLNASRRCLNIKEVVSYTTDICDAAYYAHQRGMIHRDIKPANIMLDVNDRAILMDFGIARMVGGSQHTATGAVLGTAMYMSPEQIRGLQTDARADIYSIGITLFEMVNGKPPFEADSAMTLMMMHLNDPIPNLLELHPNIPVELTSIVAKALAKKRDERYQTANELSDALRKIPEQTISPSVAASGAIQAQPVSIEATIIESPTIKDTGETVIESPSEYDPTKKLSGSIASATAPAPAQQIFEPTVMEQAVKNPPPATPAAKQAVSEAAPLDRKKGKRWLPIALVLFVVILFGGGYLGYTKFLSGGGLFSPKPSPTTFSVLLPVPTEGVTIKVTSTSLPLPTETSIPSPTSTEAPTATPAPLVIGGADKIAFLSEKNVWVANLDGSELTQLTQDDTSKNYLRWLPDGQGLSYIGGKCIYTISLAGETSQVTCFNNADKLEAFEVSPDGQQVVIGMDNQVYLVPFDLENLSNATTHDSLAAQGSCENMAPYTRNSARFVRWSSDSKSWALIAQVPYNSLRADIVAVFPVDTCYPDTWSAFDIQFPPPHFTYPGYDKFPVIQDLGFDGKSLFAFHGITRNDGFGDLHIFNMDTYKFSQSVNPINNTCCYRDAEFSPDGTYLVFAYQDITNAESSTTQLYYIPFGTIGTGETYHPLPLPEITDPKERPEPALRPFVP
jgi:serine/threonine protein kinase